MKNNNDINNTAIMAVFIFAITVGIGIGYMTAITNWVVYIVAVILILLWIGLFKDVYRLKYKPKNNNHLLKPNTNYNIDIRHGWININDCRYRYKGNIELLNLDRDGDVIMTTSNPNYITRYPVTNDYKVLITILDEIKE